MCAIWFPYTQHLNMRPPEMVVAAKGCELHTESGGILIDGISSWWTQALGYQYPDLVRRVENQLQTLSHVMLGGLSTPLAETTANKIAALLPDPLNHVFFSDSGSVGVEVALKMAVGYWHHAGLPKKRRFSALSYGYHGDTFAAMAAGDPNDGLHPDYCTQYFDTLMLPPIPMGFESDSASHDRFIAQCEGLFSRHHEELAALILEPILQGAGGMRIYSPELLNRLIKLARHHKILVIFDEVATGFYRLGRRFALSFVDALPDIIVLGKALTGGMVGHAATVASDDIFDGFLSSQSDACLMHGPTYMGNALALSAISAALDTYESLNLPIRVAEIEQTLRRLLSPLVAQSNVRDVRILGAVAAVEMNNPINLNALTDFAISRGVWLRPIGHVLYTVPPFIVTLNQLETLAQCICDWVLQGE